MHQLSGLDATFLYLETPEMPMHVGALHVLELPAATAGVLSSTCAGTCSRGSTPRRCCAGGCGGCR